MNNNFKYYEDDYEQSVLELFTNEQWNYRCGYDIHREKDDLILIDSFSQYINMRYGSLSNNELNSIVNYLTISSNPSLYRSTKDTYSKLLKGYTLNRDDGSSLFIEFINFNDIDKNIFEVVNQFEFEQFKLRRPDIVIFINGIPLSIIELKNPTDESVSIKDAYDQTHIRYYQDIPSLMKFDFINVISDGANTRYGSLFSSYEFYFKWNSTNGIDYINKDGIDSIKTLIKGLFNHKTFVNIIKNYIYIPDNSDDDLIIVPKYYQYYGTENMYENILNEYKINSGKGGTYWGATGCGKSFIMLFLAKRLTTSLELNKPTIILLTDRNDLDDQLSDDFENAKTYLIDDNSLKIKDRKMLKEKLVNVESGGIYLMTIQKFSEDIDLLSNRYNIVCISDEAHRTQTNVNEQYKIVGDETKKHFGFAKYLRDSFPNATYVGFTGTPIDSTIRVFGPVISKYTMKQSLDDGSTVGIARLPGPREVQLDEKIAKVCDEYYKLQYDQGANKYQIEESKKQMSRLKIILGNPDRLDIVVKHFIWHYEKRCAENATVNQKAMFVCYDREIAFEVYKRIKQLRPKWFEKRKCAPEYEQAKLDRDSLEIEKVKLICTTGKNDTSEFLNVVGNEVDREKFAKAFKDNKSNFKIAIVVDMWITGFDVPSLDTMYLDKPIETHNLIQTISRVNRVFKGKSEGLIVDYIGLEGAIMTAMKLYNGDLTPINGVDVSLAVFKDFIEKTKALLNDFDYSKFFDNSILPLERTELIQNGVEFVLSIKDREDKFMGYVLRAKKAYNVCIGHEQITNNDVENLHYFLCVRSMIFKITRNDTPDATLMNQKITELVNKAISSTYDGKGFDFETEKLEDTQNIFSEEFIEKIKKIKYPNTKYQALVKLLKKAITEYGKTNMLKSIEFSKRLQQVIEKYNTRNDINEISDIIDDFVNGLSGELEIIFSDLQKDQKSFEDMDITYDEKAFYDILVFIAKKYNFIDKITDEKFITLAKEIKKIVDDKSKYTDWTNRYDIRDELYFNIEVLLRKNGYPPSACDDVDDEIMKQVENFKKYND
jgi:type I restriction enzyme R subunit